MTDNSSLTAIHQFHVQMKEDLHRVIVGYDALIDLMTIALLSEGNIILEGVPGTAKTSICKMFAKNIAGEFGRLQGSVDIQPADVLGVRMYLKENDEFVFQKGPVFSNVLLVDEVNRMTPKAQAALLEALAERQVTVDNINYPLPSPFMMVATQNPYEMDGTFQLIEAQKDRFMFSIQVSHLTSEEEYEILRRGMQDGLNLERYFDTNRTITSVRDILEMQKIVRSIYVSEDIIAYIGDVVMATRTHGDVKLGVSTRGSLALLRGAQAKAAMQERDYVIPDDVKSLALYALAHRLALKRESVLGGITVSQVITDILNSVAVQ